MSPGELTNPFRAWSESVRALRDRFVAEMGDRDVSAYTGQVLGMMAGLATRCDKLGVALWDLQRHDQEAYDAFLRAMEQS